ncbi:MAG: DegT/DnrJ/EryC1/StrS family aminotransferase [Kofleriaceae bacterium]
MTSQARLALVGGTKTLTTDAPPWPTFDDSDRRALLEVLESRVWGGYHPAVGELERKFAAFHGAAHGIAIANGTVSLEIALQAAGVVAGDEVLVPPITFVASAASILRIGAKPVFVDIDPNTLNIDLDKAEAAIVTQSKAGGRVRAIVAVHFAGLPIDMDRLMKLCDQHGLVLIEDCAHAHGAEWRGRKVGSFGAFGSFSFQASKNMTSGEGGILIANDPALVERARSVVNQGRRSGGAWYEHVTLGTNARLTGFQAALLLRQLERLPDVMARKAHSAQRLRAGLAEIGGLVPVPGVVDQGVTAHGNHLFCVRLDPRAFEGIARDVVVEALVAEGIPASPGYPRPLYQNQVFKDHAHVVTPCPVAEEFCRSVFWLTHNVLLGDDRWLDGVLTAIQKVRAGADQLRTLARG